MLLRYEVSVYPVTSDTDCNAHVEAPEVPLRRCFTNMTVGEPLKTGMQHAHGHACYMQHCEGRALTLALHQLPDSFSASDIPLTLAALSAASAGAELSSCTVREHSVATSATGHQRKIHCEGSDDHQHLCLLWTVG